MLIAKRSIVGVNQREVPFFRVRGWFAEQGAYTAHLASLASKAWAHFSESIATLRGMCRTRGGAAESHSGIRCESGIVTLSFEG